jgi:hypothetical protein
MKQPEAAGSKQDVIGQEEGVSEQRAEDFEEVRILLHEVEGPSRNVLNVPKLLLALGMAESGVDAMRALAEKAVTLDDKVSPITVKLPPLPARIVVQVRKRNKVAVIDEKFEGEKTAERARPFPRLRDKTSNPGGTPAPVTA